MTYEIGSEPTLVLDTPPEGLDEALAAGPVKLEIVVDRVPIEGEGPLELSIKTIAIGEMEDDYAEAPEGKAGTTDLKAALDDMGEMEGMEA